MNMRHSCKKILKKVRLFIDSVKSQLPYEEPFPEYFRSPLMEENIFIDYFAPYLRETIEECFCAKVRCEGKQDFVVQFDTGERLELHLSCKISEQT